MTGDNKDKAINQKNCTDRNKSKNISGESEKVKNRKGVLAESADLFKLPDFDFDDDDEEEDEDYQPPPKV